MKHGGARRNRTNKVVAVKILHLEVAADAYDWVQQVADALLVSKAEALERIVGKDRERVNKRHARACIEAQKVSAV